MMSPARFRRGRIVSLNPLSVSVEGLPVEAERIIQLKGAFDLAPMIAGLEDFKMEVGDQVALLPDDDDGNYILLGVIK